MTDPRLEPVSRCRVAVVGAGVSGLLTAWILARVHDVTLYEAASYAGGHTNTIGIEDEGTPVGVDTGFIVYNERNYPNFTKLLGMLGVASQPSDMSFSVKCGRTGLEYCGTSLNTLFAQRSNVFRPRVYRILNDIMRFHREARALLDGLNDDERTIGEFLDERRYSRLFVDQYLVPMAAAVWSAGEADVRAFPLGTFLRFFENHGFLQVKGRPLWRVVRGGSRIYVRALLDSYGGALRLATPVESILRRDERVHVRTVGEQEAETYDRVVVAVHSDQALRLLADASPGEREVLGAIPYQENEAVLHTDETLMPRARRAWASWNAYVPPGIADRTAVTYYMNRLQGLRTAHPYFVTLNRSDDIDPDRVLRRITYHHPVFDTRAPTAQRRLREINGSQNTWYGGAWTGNGFHEDGVNSALAVCRDFGLEL